MKGPRIYRPIAEEGDGHALLLATMEGQGNPGGNGDRLGDDAVAPPHACLEISGMHASTLPATEACRLAVDLREQPPRVRAFCQIQAMAAVVAENDIRTFQGVADPHSHTLLSSGKVAVAVDLTLRVGLLHHLLKSAY